MFEIQDRVVADVLESVRNQQAIEAAPKIVDPIQQLVVTVLQQQRNNPAVSAGEVRAALKSLREPVPAAYVKDLRAAYEAFQRDGEVERLLAAVQALEVAEPEEHAERAVRPLQDEELHLVCWEYVWS